MSLRFPGSGRGSGDGGGSVPAATESTAGKVQGATDAQSKLSSDSTILGWSVDRLRTLVARALPTVSQTHAEAGTRTARNAWSALRVRQAIRAVFTSALEGRVPAEPVATTDRGKAWSVPSDSDTPGWYVPASAPAAGVRTERLAVQNHANTGSATYNTDVELTPVSTNPVTVVRGSGAAELITGLALNSNDFTLAAGAYLIKVRGEYDAAGEAVFELDVRQASDDAILTESTAPYFRNTGGEQTYRGFGALATLDLASDTLVNLYVQRRGRGSNLRNMTVAFTRLGS